LAPESGTSKFASAGIGPNASLAARNRPDASVNSARSTRWRFACSRSSAEEASHSPFAIARRKPPTRAIAPAAGVNARTC